MRPARSGGRHGVPMTRELTRVAAGGARPGRARARDAPADPRARAAPAAAAAKGAPSGGGGCRHSVERRARDLMQQFGAGARAARRRGRCASGAKPWCRSRSQRKPRPSARTRRPSRRGRGNGRTMAAIKAQAARRRRRTRRGSGEPATLVDAAARTTRPFGNRQHRRGNCTTRPADALIRAAEKLHRVVQVTGTKRT